MFPFSSVVVVTVVVVVVSSEVEVVSLFISVAADSPAAEPVSSVLGFSSPVVALGAGMFSSTIVSLSLSPVSLLNTVVVVVIVFEPSSFSTSTFVTLSLVSSIGIGIGIGSTGPSKTSGIALLLSSTSRIHFGRSVPDPAEDPVSVVVVALDPVSVVSLVVVTVVEVEVELDPLSSTLGLQSSSLASSFLSMPS